jgi:hypothetical protein
LHDLGYILFQPFVVNPFKFIRNKPVLCPQRDSLPLKKMLCPHRFVLPIETGTTARCRLKWSFGALFLKFELAGCRLERLFGALQILKKSCQKAITIDKRASTPNQITQ